MATVDKDTEAVNRIQKSMANIGEKARTSNEEPLHVGDIYNHVVAIALYRVFSDANGETPEDDFHLYERAAEALHQSHPSAYAALAADSFKEEG